MPAPPPRDERACFSGFELDFRSGDLSRPDGSRIILADQPFRILATLVKARGALVTREDLCRELWPGNTFVDFEHSLNAGVKRLRESIGDSATAPRFIETIPRRGYRFIAPVEIIAGPADAAIDAPPPRAGDASEHTTAVEGDARRHWRRHTWLAACGIGVVAAAAAVWLGTAATSGPLLPLDGRLVRLTTDVGLSIDPVLSPTGSLVAYASDRQGETGLDIWVQSVAGGTATRLTADTGDETEPDFSPDGASIAYAARERGGIFVVGALGGEPRLVASANRARTPRFSPDGKWIAYWTGLPVWNDFGGAAGAQGALAIVPATGGTPRGLAADVASARYAVWSSDGKRLLFVGDRLVNGQHRGDWFTVSREGGNATETGALEVLRTAGVAGVPIPGAWTADGTVVFGVTGEQGNVWALSISPATGRVAGKLRRLTFGSGHEQSPTIGASGAVAFASVAENVDVWRAALNPKSGAADGAFERVTSDAATDSVMNVTDDGARLVFMSSRSGRNEVWVRDVSTGRDKQLTFAGALGARISRDGSLVAVIGSGSRSSVELTPADGGPSRPLCEDCAVTDWSPDGSRVLLARGHPARIFVRDVTSGREIELASHPVWNLYQARFSPDGRWVVFHTTNATAVRQVYLVPVDRATPVPFERWVPVVTDFGIQPSWSSDGRGIYYFSLRDGFFCAWLQPLDSVTHAPLGASRAVAHLHDPRLRAVEGAVVTNDVRAGFLYATLTEMTGNIWLLRR